MGQTKKRNYDRYTLAFKLQAVKLANHPEVRSKDVADIFRHTFSDALPLANGTQAR